MRRTLVLVLCVAFSQQQELGYYYYPQFGHQNNRFNFELKTVVDIQRSISWYLGTNGELIPYYSEGTYQPSSLQLDDYSYNPVIVQNVPFGEGYYYTKPVKHFDSPPSNSYGAPSSFGGGGGGGFSGKKSPFGGPPSELEMDIASNEVSKPGDPPLTEDQEKKRQCFQDSAIHQIRNNC